MIMIKQDASSIYMLQSEYIMKLIHSAPISILLFLLLNVFESFI